MAQDEQRHAAIATTPADHAFGLIFFSIDGKPH
jgi:hypothetical protein